MNRRIEVEKFAPGPTFENTINEIKYYHLKVIAYTTMNISSFTLFDNNIETLSMNNNFEAEKTNLNQYLKRLLMNQI